LLRWCLGKESCSAERMVARGIPGGVTARDALVICISDVVGVCKLVDHEVRMASVP